MAAMSDISEYLTIDNVRQDKVEITIGRWIVGSVDTEMTGFLQYLGSDEAHYRRHIYRAFQSDDRISPVTAYNLKVLSSRRGRTHAQMAPLFAGNLNVRRMRELDNYEQYSLRLKLSINPTRFCVYQETPYRTRSLGRQISGSTQLFATQNRTSYKSEHSLDGNDNVILRPGAEINASHQFWEQNFRRYISEIETYFNEELASYISDGFRLLDFENTYIVKRLENYWDIQVNDAVAFVKSLEPTFIALSNDSSISIYSDADLFHEGSAICLRGKFRSGERLKIYAKTNNRVRIEVEHRYDSNPNLSESRTYSRQGLDDLFEFFSGAATSSTHLATEFWQTIRRHASLSETGSGSALYFVRELYSVVGDIELAGEILSLMVNQGGVPTNRLTPEMKAAFRSLTTAGLTERHGRPLNRYVIAPRFQASLSHLH